MVSDRHRKHHRIARRVIALVVKVFERCPLNRVTRIQQQKIGICLARFPDEGSHFRDPHVVVLVGVVIDGKDVAVHVGRAQDDDVCARAILGRGVGAATDYENETCKKYLPQCFHRV